MNAGQLDRITKSLERSAFRVASLIESDGCSKDDINLPAYVGSLRGLLECLELLKGHQPEQIQPSVSENPAAKPSKHPSSKLSPAELSAAMQSVLDRGVERILNEMEAQDRAEYEFCESEIEDLESWLHDVGCGDEPDWRSVTNRFCRAYRAAQDRRWGAEK